jgi:hypothetical protein
MNHSDILQLLSTTIIKTHDYTLIGKWNRINKKCYEFTKEKMGNGCNQKEAKHIILRVMKLKEHLETYPDNEPTDSMYFRVCYAFDFFYIHWVQNLQYIRFWDRLILVCITKLIEFCDEIGLYQPSFIQYTSGSINPMKTLISYGTNYGEIRKTVVRYGQYMDLPELDLFFINERELEEMEWRRSLICQLPFQ